MTAQERSDPSKTAEILDSFFKGKPESDRQNYLKFLADDIEFLSQRYPDRWGIASR